MKCRKFWTLLLVALMTASLLAGCGGSSIGYTSDMKVENGSMEAPMAEEQSDSLYSGAASGTGAEQVTSEQKLIKRVTIEAETEDLETLLGTLAEEITQLGGYVESQQLYNGSSHSSYRYRSASMTVRIPAENLDGFVGQIKGASNVVTYNETTEDVTLTYVATESRMKALQAEEERLLELMDKAETMSDLLEVEERLTEVRSELESVTSQLRVLSNKVSYATVYLDIEQVKVYTEVEEPTVWQRITSGFTGNLEDIGEGLVDFFVWVITYSPQLIFWAVVIALGITAGKKAAKKRKAAKMPPKTEEE